MHPLKAPKSLGYRTQVIRRALDQAKLSYVDVATERLRDTLSHATYVHVANAAEVDACAELLRELPWVGVTVRANHQLQSVKVTSTFRITELSPMADDPGDRIPMEEIRVGDMIRIPRLTSPNYPDVPALECWEALPRQVGTITRTNHLWRITWHNPAGSPYRWAPSAILVHLGHFGVRLVMRMPAGFGADVAEAFAVLDRELHGGVER